MAVTDDTTIIPFRQSGSVTDPLTEIARDGARRMLMAALTAEADSLVAQFSEDLLVDCRKAQPTVGTIDSPSMKTTQLAKFPTACLSWIAPNLNQIGCNLL